MSGESLSNFFLVRCDVILDSTFSKLDLERMNEQSAVKLHYFYTCKGNFIMLWVALFWQTLPNKKKWAVVADFFPHDIKFLEEVQRNNKGSEFWFSSEESVVCSWSERRIYPFKILQSVSEDFNQK